MQPTQLARPFMLAFAACALAISAQAQISVTSPSNNSTVSMPVWLRAHASSCAGSTNMTLFEYSIGNSAFSTPGITNYDIDTTDYRLSSQPSPGSQYVIHYKAWSDKGACTPVDVTVNVSGAATHSAQNVDDVGNAASWNPNPCPSQNNTSGLTGWFWQWDAGTAQCTLGDSNTYLVGSGSPNIDGQSRIFYVDWKATNGGTPGERYSETFGNDVSATNVVYDTYIYITDPQNIQDLEMDTNQVWDSSGDVVIFGIQCGADKNGNKTWQYTTNTGTNAKPVDTWNPTTLPCNPQDATQWAPNTWHHVQLVAQHDSSGNATYEEITLDGKSQTLSEGGYDSFGVGWPAGNLLLNLQIDGINNGGNEATVTAYIDGMTMIWW